jgi:hypothetical protein
LYSSDEPLDLEPDELDQAHRADGLGLDTREEHAARRRPRRGRGIMRRAGSLGAYGCDAGIRKRLLHQPLDRLLAGRLERMMRITSSMSQTA